MLSYSLAILSALFFAGAHVCIRKGLTYSTPRNALFLSIPSQAFCFWTISPFLVSWRAVRIDSIWPFVFARLISPALARYLNYLGIQKLGVAVNSVVLNTSPLFAIGVDIGFLKERVNISILGGTLLILAGLTVISYRKSEFDKWPRSFLLFPALAACLYGTYPNMIKYGLRGGGNSILAGLTQVTTSLVLLTIFLVLLDRGKPAEFSHGARWFFVGAGFLSFLAFASYYTALIRGNVVNVIPISNSAGLFGILLAHIFLRNQERITWRVVIAGILIFLASTLLIYFNPLP